MRASYRNSDLEVDLGIGEALVEAVILLGEQALHLIQQQPLLRTPGAPTTLMVVSIVVVWWPG